MPSRSIALLLIVAAPLTASATSDSGTKARLVGVLGQRYALIVEENVQEGCFSLDCTAYLVDLRQRRFRRLHPVRIPPRQGGAGTDRQLAAAVAARLPPALAGLMRRGWSPARKLRRLRIDEKKPGRPLVARRGDASWTLRLRRTGTFPSMRAYSRKGADQLCRLPQARPPALCSKCKAAKRVVDGRPVEIMSCDRGTGTITVNGESRPCDCHAPGALLRFEVTRHKAVHRGSTFVVEPHALAQNVMEGRRPKESISVELGGEVSGFLAPGGQALFVGGAANAPTGNGTYFPVVAIVRSWVRVRR